MFRKLICPISFIFVISLALTSSANAELIGWWKFDEGSGTIAADSSGNGHNGTINGGATWAAGQLDGALRFDGTDDYVNCGLININTAVTGGMTVCAWINKPAGGDMKFCTNRQVAEDAGGGFTCAIYNNRLEMDFENATSRNLNRDTDGPTIPANTWVHVAWVYDDVANTFSEYHNGVLADSSTENVSVGVSTQAFRIGANSPGLDHYVNGLIDDLRIYNHTLSQVEIQQAMLGWGPVLVFASNPNPADEQIDMPRDCVLNWMPGDYAAKHNVYLGTDFNDVNNASLDNHPGMQFSQNQDANTYQPDILLDFVQK
ncbi:MAG: LamG domain-containing protein, partial [Sedimentisphaerales bacterium]|nr:LamG domain-containing protein [Sedimentisphaerales bacterium]